jgi:glucose-1-phosphate thymidylyltransferase
MKGIILSGGNGSRLYPLTNIINKQMIPVYDKPMIYYPFSTLINFGIKEFCIISTTQHINSYEKIFKDGSDLGLKICYKIQKEPKGIAEALIIAEDFINNDNVALILGDNIFHGITKTKLSENGATIVTYEVDDPSAYGVLEVDKNGTPISIEEKPCKPKSNLAICGLYFYDQKASEYAKSLKPSKRGELEITDLNKIYLEKNQLNVLKCPKGSVWLDAGTPETLFESAAYIHTIQKRQGFKIGCIEEETYRSKNINKKQFINLINNLPSGDYKNYLQKLI